MSDLQGGALQIFQIKQPQIFLEAASSANCSQRPDDLSSFHVSVLFMEAGAVTEKQCLHLSLNSDIFCAKIMQSVSFASFFCRFLSDWCISY